MKYSRSYLSLLYKVKKEKKYFTSNGDIIEYFFSEDLKDSPIVFGEPEKFKVFYLNFKKKLIFLLVRLSISIFSNQADGI